MNETDLAWAAGFIDGDGMMQVIKVRSHEYSGLSLRLRATGTVRKPLERLQGLFGGSIFKARNGGNQTQPQWKPIYSWQVTGKRAQNAIKHLQPFLSVREGQSAVAEVYRFDSKYGHPLTKYIQEECYAQMKILNQRGVA